MNDLGDDMINKVKNVPKIRFSGYTHAWEKRKLGEIGSVVMNKRIFKNETLEFGEIPFYKIGTFGKQADAFISRELFEEYKDKYPYPKVGDILISASGTLGRTVVYNGEEAYYQDSNIVWLQQNNKIVNNSFLKQFYNIVKWGVSEGSTIKRLYNSNILSTKIIYPIISEQTKIGNFFQVLDNLLALHQRKCNKLKELKKGYLQKMFPKGNEKTPEIRFSFFDVEWEINKLGNISKMYQPQTITGDDLLESGIAVFGANSYIGYYSEWNHYNDQVTISARGEGTGTPNYVNGPAWITGNSMVLNTDNYKIDKQFLYANLSANSLRKYVTGGAQPQLTRDVLEKTPITISTYKEQIKIGNLFQTLDQQINQQETKLKHLKQLKQAYLQNMFV
ncbi:restriction endonuclease subunit S [Lactococcus raffinolactis]|uniref:restriction endonuclease subunit S n=1 Tax=Pseudolactococcus raffinolactis TaxID=1366 RepID=UPI00288CC8EC|nr:restriction endonuclease subunit S [Lactococcus raffinolactis]MDT2765489.1 restriction endonuclease subunit S [Lactococcus raffinolactis]MDT2788360.1 restriction endonuclease subunit S [Lactococcus raffinolactis]